MTKNKNSVKVIAIVFLLAGIFLVDSGRMMFDIGLSKADYGWNLRIVNMENNQTYGDININYELKTSLDLVIDGYNGEMEGFEIAVMGWMLFGIGIGLTSMFLIRREYV
jgi:hypothetical protein